MRHHIQKTVNNHLTDEQVRWLNKCGKKLLKKYIRYKKKRKKYKGHVNWLTQIRRKQLEAEDGRTIYYWEFTNPPPDYLKFLEERTKQAKLSCDGASPWSWHHTVQDNQSCITTCKFNIHKFLKSKVTKRFIMSTVKVEADKELLKKLILKFGKSEVERSRNVWRRIMESPFNNILLGAFSLGGKGDEFAFKSFYEIRFKAKIGKASTVAEFIERQINQGKLDKLVKELGFAQEMLEETLKGLINLNKKYNLDKRTDLRDVNADEFYNDLKSVKGFGAEEGKILPWIISDLVRVWDLEVPKDLKLSENSRETLEKLGLEPNDFDVKDYPYVDSAMFALSKDC